MASTAYVTGAAGFVGRHLTERLVEQRWRVTAFCRPTDRTEVLPAEVDVELGDVIEPGAVLDTLPPDTDAVFHLAANTTTWSKNREAQFRVNVEGTARVIDAVLARQAGRLVYTSSISSFGYQPGVVISETTPSNAPQRGDNYGKSKLFAEQRILGACTEHGLNAVILNPVNIVGPYDATNWSKQLILPIATGRLPLVPPGSATWMSVHDVAAAQIAAVRAGRIGCRIILGGVRASFKEVINTIEQLLGKPLTTRVTPKPVLAAVWLASVAKAAITGTEPEFTRAKYRRAVGDLIVDDRIARTELGLGRTSLRDQLAQTIDWLDDVGPLPAKTGTPHDR